MEDFVPPLLTGLAGLIVSAIATYAGTGWKIRKELEREYDTDLRRLRLGVYPALWKATQTFALYGRQPKRLPTRDELETTTEALRAWYFETGGLYLSKETREEYFALQRGLKAVLASQRWHEERIAELDEDSFEDLQKLSSRLRTRLTLDVGTRKPFSLEQPGDEEPGLEQAVERIHRSW